VTIPRSPDSTRLLFTPGARLGWTFRDRRTLITPYPEPPPDPELIRRQTAARTAAAERKWQHARRWVARPTLIAGIALAMLAGCAKAINSHSHTSPILATALIVAVPGLAWTLWRWIQRTQAAAANPAQAYGLARQQHQQRASTHEQAELARLGDLPEWGSAEPPAHRTDIFGGTLAGWRALLTVHGASILSRQPLLVADLSGQHAATGLADLTRHANVPTAVYLLPHDLDRSGILTRLTPPQLAAALAEAIHAGTPASRTDRAVDVRVLEHLCTALQKSGITPARLAAAAEVALGRPGPSGLLTQAETGLIRGPLLGDDYKTRVGANLIRLDAFLSDLARHTGTGPPQTPVPAWCTLLVTEPAARSAHGELLTALVIQWLTIQVSGSTATTPAVIIASADEITRDHLERLAGACEHRGVHLTLLFRHLRDDATALIGGGATAFMRLGNHLEAEQAANFLGRHYKFVLSGFTATLGGSQSRSGGFSYNYGTADSRGSSVTASWTDNHLLNPTASGSRTHSRDRSVNEGWSMTTSQEEGTNWSDAVSSQRVHEYAVEPVVLQQLPDHALLLASRSGTGAGIVPVESHPAIVTLPHTNTHPLAPPGYDQRRTTPPVTSKPARPELEPHQPPPQWSPASGSPADAQWLPRQSAPGRPPPRNDG